MTTEASKPMTIEQMCRNLLEAAMKDGSVRKPLKRPHFDPHPQARSGGELAGMANMLQEYFREAAKAAKQ
jgi:hypothetical protein